MADAAALRAKLWTALTELPKPVTREAIEACAKEMLPGKESGEFAKWLDSNSAHVLGTLNG